MTTNGTGAMWIKASKPTIAKLEAQIAEQKAVARRNSERNCRPYQPRQKGCGNAQRRTCADPDMPTGAGKTVLAGALDARRGRKMARRAARLWLIACRWLTRPARHLISYGIPHGVMQGRTGAAGP